MRGQLAGLWRAGAGRELLVLVTAKTQKQKPENRKPVAVGNIFLYVQKKPPTTGQSDLNNQRRR